MNVTRVFLEDYMKESEIEKRLVKRVRERGGICYKFVSPNNRGVPDRIVITPQGRTIYVELKAENGKLSFLQEWQIKNLRSRQCDVRVLKGLTEVECFVKEVFPNDI